uniref:HEPN domain-containing protein n=1 Tax=Candidatus Kentrum sp. LPFa TaxID=2126335 RepID=A0A450WN85_9GAMM|nr:MAG: HEPN domain-containing protein [Candidatus Kentron sp. LPFa]VFK33073.1 MAG: HEPN domain-containing protein [Candidatus Kentron sp. LPFa]
MNTAKQQLIQSWLDKAEHDLSAARILAASTEPVLDAAIYHCRQAAEKAVKAFLVFRDEDVPTRLSRNQVRP